MTTDQIWDLFEFCNKNCVYDNDWHDVTFTSKSCPDYEIVAECIEDDDNETDGDRVWKIGINTIPYDEDKATDWLWSKDCFRKPPCYEEGERMGELISKCNDWVVEQASARELGCLLADARQHLLIDFDSWRMELSWPANLKYEEEKNETA